MMTDKLLDFIPNAYVEWKTLGEVSELRRGNGLQKKNFVESGMPVIHYGQIYTHYGNFADSVISYVKPELFEKLVKANKGDVIITNTSENYEDVGTAVGWLGDFEIATGGHATVISPNRKILNGKYLVYLTKTNGFQKEKRRLAKGTKVIDVSANDMAKIKIPIPSLEIQQKVVEILDKMTDYVTELTAELTLRKKQYAYYRAQLLTFPSPSDSDESHSVKWMTLGEISSMISTGVTPKAGNPDYYENGTIPWLRTNEVKFNEIYSTEKLVTQKAFDETSIKWVPENSVIVAISGATAGRVAINKIPLTTNQHCCCISLNDSQVDYKFVYHWLVKQNDKILELKQGARGDLNMGMLRSFKIPVPSLSDQKRIVEILDKFDKLTSDFSEGLPREIELRQKQYEYWREQLLSFR